MPQFVHLHVHSQYSILDGQASIQRLVDKAMADGQPGIAVTDHGDMFGIKEFYNYVQKVKGKCKDKAAEAEARIAALRDGTETCADPAAEIAKCERQLEECRRKLAFKPIIGCEVYVARRRLHDKEGKPDQSGYHLILLAKNLEGYNAAIALVQSNDLAGAKKAIAKDNSADADYLRAVIAAKEGDLKTAEAQLKSAVSKNPALAQKAAKDINLKALKK